MKTFSHLIASLTFFSMIMGGVTIAYANPPQHGGHPGSHHGHHHNHNHGGHGHGHNHGHHRFGRNHEWFLRGNQECYIVPRDCGAEGCDPAYFVCEK